VCTEMSHSIQPSFSALNTSEKLDRQQSIYICFGPIIPVKVPLPALVHVLSRPKRQHCPPQYRVLQTRRTAMN
ncbi:hypothetical protein ACIPZ5_27295, partial [Pseudomonas sp. NPDC089428]|uniref:hypothetical protein n=1 Tax=Pseudomonas sp. NPDC089428 TaxID=3364467 RepID=UPI0038009F21